MVTDLGSVGMATKLHATALKALRSRLPKSIPYGEKFELNLGRVFIRADESVLLVYLDDVRVYGWEKRAAECHTNYLTASLAETLDVLQREMILESLSDV